VINSIIGGLVGGLAGVVLAIAAVFLSVFTTGIFEYDAPCRLTCRVCSASFDGPAPARCPSCGLRDTDTLEWPNQAAGGTSMN